MGIAAANSEKFRTIHAAMPRSYRMGIASPLGGNHIGGAVPCNRLIYPPKISLEMVGKERTNRHY
jgi:hypothetical protein